MIKAHTMQANLADGGIISNTQTTPQKTQNNNPEENIHGNNSTAPNTSQSTLFDNLMQWCQNYEDICNSALEELDKATSAEEEDKIMEEFEAKCSQMPEAFNFMEGNDPKDENAYNLQLNKLAQGEMQAKDANQNKEVDIEEYVMDEVKEYFGKVSQDEMLDMITSSYLMYSLIDEGMGNSDANGKLSEAEFEDFYKNMDRFENGELKDEVDGEFHIDDASTYTSYLIDNIFNDDIKTQVKGTVAQKILAKLVKNNLQ